jgi:CheY-like chemotaxis protein
VLQCECVVADNGELAVQLLGVDHTFDIVLMDCQMPVLDGFEATRRVRRLEAALKRRTPIVALTANAMLGDREECLAAGMDDFLSKPFQLSQLAAKLARWGRATHAADSSEQLAEGQQPRQARQ